MRTLTQTPKISVALTVVLSLAGATAGAQENLMIYPQRGQNADQQSKDRYECHTWAVQQSGFDPANPQSAGSTSGASSTGREALRGGARGAAAGAAIGAIAGDAGKGAAIGATAGGLRRGFKERDRQRAESAAGTASPAQQAYQRAMAACMEGRGYSVK
jgi:hypothetical protein